MGISIRIDRNVPVEMRDGSFLKADIIRPDDKQRRPAILTITPYGREREIERESVYFNLIKTIDSGYARIYEDLRNSYAAEDYTAAGLTGEEADCYDTVEWIANQPWCDGSVGMQGFSAMGRIQWITAEQNPPHLKAIAPGMVGATKLRTLGGNLFGGFKKLNIKVGLTVSMGENIASRLEKQGKDASQLRQLLERVNSNPEELYNFLPLKDAPLLKIASIRELWDAPYFDISDPKIMEKVIWAYHKVKVPCFQISGWYDFSAGDIFQNYLNMKEKGGSKLSREKQYILIGPWLHGGAPRTVVGSLSYGAMAAGFSWAGQTTERTLAFFDKYLRGMDINIPTFRYFVMGRNVWRDADGWPLPQTQWQRFFLHSKGRANTSEGDGFLSRSEPVSETPDTFIYNPLFPVPTAGGRGAEAEAGFLNGPMDQSHIERRNDVLCYTTSEFKDDIEVTGPLELHLFASTSAQDTDFSVKLVDVYPNGRSFNISDGIVRARYRNSIFNPEFVKPGIVNEYIIKMMDTSQVFRRGHRLRVNVTSSNFPEYDRNMNTGNPVWEDEKGVPALQTIFHESGYSSYIDLPVIPGI